jgi:hypothetical protein
MNNAINTPATYQIITPVASHGSTNEARAIITIPAQGDLMTYRYGMALVEAHRALGVTVTLYNTQAA